MRTIHLIRGLPGSGKTTLAKKIIKDSGVSVKESTIVAADDFFYDDVSYRFDPSRIGEAHAWCQCYVARAMMNRDTLIVVHNTFTMRWEMNIYYWLADMNGYRVVVEDLFDSHMTDEQLFQRNVHGVPLEQIARMRARYER